METPPTFPGLAGLIITALQVLVVATSYANEANPKTRAQYSKFSQASDESKTWPSRLGMMVIYTPALIASATLLVLGIKRATIPGDVVTIPLPSWATFLCSIHMAKRCLEILFLHKYSGRTDRGTPMMIGFFYALQASLVAYGGGQEKGQDPSISMVIMGTILFAIGIGGNFYHHHLLATLRSTSTDSAKKYVAPRGGLFGYVATPHYLFELIGWLGIAIVSHHINVYLTFAGMCSYLGGRSVAQNEFNRRNFDEKEWPIERKNMVPFIF